jgi:galactokinase
VGKASVRVSSRIGEELVAGVMEEFQLRHPELGAPRAFFAPGRVNLMGAHLDYNGGVVLPAAIDRGTVIAVASRSDGQVRFTSQIEGGEHSFDLARLPDEATGSWADYPLGVVRAMLSLVGAAPRGVSFHYGGNLPIGAGLSSSASMCVGTAHALAGAWDLELEPIEPVHIALSAEREFVGVRCGIMDPHAVGLAREGQLLCLECKDASYEYLPLDAERLCILVADTGVRRELAATEFNQRVEECRQAFEILRVARPDATCLAEIDEQTLSLMSGELGPVLSRRAAHVIAEVGRTEVAREGLRLGRPEVLGAMMLEAHASLRGLYEVSCLELDRLVELAGPCDGVLGGRLTGAGFGGACVFLVERGAEEEVSARLVEGYQATFGREPDLAVFQAAGGPVEFEI